MGEKIKSGLIHDFEYTKNGSIRIRRLPTETVEIVLDQSNECQMSVELSPKYYAAMVKEMHDELDLGTNDNIRKAQEAHMQEVRCSNDFAISKGLFREWVAFRDEFFIKAGAPDSSEYEVGKHKPKEVNLNPPLKDWMLGEIVVFKRSDLETFSHPDMLKAQPSIEHVIVVPMKDMSGNLVLIPQTELEKAFPKMFKKESDE